MANKTSPRRFKPGLFDLPQDITKGLPLDIVDAWASSDQTSQNALEILRPTQVQGIAVSSDSAGLTRLSQEKRLIEILAIINKPKEIVHAYGSAIGGQAVGIWAADNTQMLYPASISAEVLMSTLLAAQHSIAEQCSIRIGLGAHHGTFYNISGGLYGPEADAIEELAENETAGGELVITNTLKNKLPDKHGFSFILRDDLDSPLGQVFRVTDGPWLIPSGNQNPNYPVPYSEEFYADLIAYERQPDDSFLQKLEQKHLKEKVVVLVEREHEQSDHPETRLLNDLAVSVLMRKTSNELLGQSGKEIKITGALGIYVFDTCENATEFAQAFRKELNRQNIRSRTGIDKGPVLIFELKEGGYDIAGMPVNIASKMSQDKGKWDHIYMTKPVADQVDATGFVPIVIEASGVKIEAFEG